MPLGSLEDFLNRWTHEARKRFLRDGCVDPFVLTVSPCGATTWLSCGELRDEAESEAFMGMVDEFLDESDSVRAVIVLEKADALPSPGQRWRGVLLVSAFDGESKMATSSAIEEDDLGVPKLRPAERVD